MVPAIGRVPGAGGPPDGDVQKRRLKETCQEFESMLTNYLFKSMREGSIRAEEPDQGSQMYEGMMDETLARELSRHNPHGLADILYEQLLPLIAEAPAKTASQGPAAIKTGEEP